MSTHDCTEGGVSNNHRPHGVLEKYFQWLRYISVEPTMWLYMMAYMITTVVEQDFFFYKACRVNHDFSEETCRNITKNDVLNKAVQVTVTEFHQWNNIAGHIVPIILALFFGNWSDRHGRKLPLILGLLGKVIYSGMIVVNTLMPRWDVFMIIYTATIPMSILCGDVAIFASCFAYISDVSSFEQRTLRVTVLDIVYLSTMPTGIALGSYLFTHVFPRSYTALFIINTSLLVISVFYSLIQLKWQTSSRQQPVGGINIFKDFFDKEHVIATINTLRKRRPRFRRLHLWILFLTMALYTFQRDEKHYQILYMRDFFQWNVASLSNFWTFKSFFFIFALLVCAPIMSKVFKLRDTTIVCIGALSHAAARVFFALGTTVEIFYAGAVVAAIGPVVAPVLRSITSKVVSINERGKVFAILAVCDNTTPFISGILYSQLYNATLHILPTAFFWLTFSTQIAVLLLILLIHFSSSPNECELNEYEPEITSNGNPVIINPNDGKS